jgi:putative membrane protein
MSRSWVWLLAVSITASACRDKDRDDAPSADTLAANAADAHVNSSLAPLRAASTAEAQFAEVGVQRATRDPVRRYAQVVVADHRAVTAVLDSVARAQSIRLDATAAARDVESGMRNAHAGLQAISPEEFDLAFIRAEVDAQRQLVDRLDRELIPNARGDDTRKLMQDVRAMSDAHLTRARQILTELLGVAPPSAFRPATVTPRATPRSDTASRERPDTVTQWRPPESVQRERPDTESRWRPPDSVRRERPDTGNRGQSPETAQPARRDTVKPMLPDDDWPEDLTPRVRPDTARPVRPFSP